MSKELTEKWKNGELDVLFDVYVKIPDEVIPVRKIYYLNQYLETKLSDEIEVLAPVPTYDQFVELTEKASQFSQMVKKVDELEKEKVELLEKIEELVQKIHILNEANMNLENTVGKFGEQLNIALKALRELKPRLESEDDWLIVARALREIEEIDDSLGKCEIYHIFPSENVKGGADE